MVTANPVLKGKARSELSKAIWRRRKREGGKATCLYCSKPIYARGVKSPSGKPYHKSCFEEFMAGLAPAQVGKNPARKIPITRVVIGHLGGYPPKPYFAGLERGIAVLRQKEFKEWSDAEKYARKLADETGLPIQQLNPKGTEERRRAPRDAFRYFGAKELNPALKCPKCARFMEMHRLGGGLPYWWCSHCKAAYLGTESAFRNPKYKFGPTGFRPPAKWFAKIAQGAAASYFGKKLKDLTRVEAAKVGQIVGGIWAKFSDATRMEILKKYEPSAVRANVLPCPKCSTMNPVDKAGVYLRCRACGVPLQSVKVRRK